MEVQGMINTPIFINYTTETESKGIMIEADTLSPFVKFNGEKGLLLIKGKSLGKNAEEFYSPLITLVDSHLIYEEKLTCYFYFKEFNLSTAKSLFHLFKTLGEHHIKGRKITVNWFADWHNSEMIQPGIDFAEMFGLKVHILPI